MTPDPRAQAIAKAFCRAHTNQKRWPCGWCRQRAKEALRNLADMPQLFDPGDPNPAELSDPSACTEGVTAASAGDTSKAAALAVFPRSGTQRLALLRLVVENEKNDYAARATDDWLARTSGLSLNTVRPRRGELVAGGWLTDSGATDTTSTGHQAVVWCLTDRAVDHFVSEAEARADRQAAGL